jgi:hypothetical protein
LETAAETARETATETARPETTTTEKAPRFTGVHAENYRIAYTVCGVFPVRKVARDLGLQSSDPVRVAEKYSEDYRPGFRGVSGRFPRQPGEREGGEVTWSRREILFGRVREQA